MSSVFKYAKYRELPLFDHQAAAIERMLEQPRMLDASDAGTGKTRTAIEVIRQRAVAQSGQTLVLAPKSILEAAWANDLDKFAPELSYVVAYAKNRAEAFDNDSARVIITNHDAVKWLNSKSFGPARFKRQFNQIFVDESSAFKHRTSQRSRALLQLSRLVDYMYLMTGTPTSNSITDIWHQILLLDGGERLGKQFFAFRFATQTSKQVGPNANMVQWFDKPGAEGAVTDLIADITIRNKFEDCHSIPANHMFEVPFDLTPKHRRAYKRLMDERLLELQTGDVSAMNAANVTQKLLQLASGAVYDDDSETQIIDTARHELVLELIMEREQCVVAYNWQHQLEGLTEVAAKNDISFGVINGTKNEKERLAAVDAFQRGELRVLFIHPQSGAHGLTLTKGTTTIWASPTYNAEHFVQFNRRIYRAGQTRRTETILVAATDTLESEVYERLHDKRTRMSDLLDMLGALSGPA